MAFKFIVKDEDLPKPTTLSTIHIISISAGIILFTLKNIPLQSVITFGFLELIQVIYLAVFYKKIVWERYANPTLRTVTISFISVNIFLALFSLLIYATGSIISLLVLILTLATVFTLSFFVTNYLRKTNALKKIKAVLASPKDFTFPFYKFTAIIPMFIILPGIFLKSKICIAVSIALLTIGYIYTALGEIYNTKKKDELDRLIKYEASYISIQILPGIIIPLFLIESFFKIQIPWSFVLIVFVLIHALIQTVINKRYE